MCGRRGHGAQVSDMCTTNIYIKMRAGKLQWAIEMHHGGYDGN